MPHGMDGNRGWSEVKLATKPISKLSTIWRYRISRQRNPEREDINDEKRRGKVGLSVYVYSSKEQESRRKVGVYQGE